MDGDINERLIKNNNTDDGATGGGPDPLALLFISIEELLVSSQIQSDFAYSLFTFLKIDHQSRSSFPLA